MGNGKAGAAQIFLLPLMALIIFRATAGAAAFAGAPWPSHSRLGSTGL